MIAIGSDHAGAALKEELIPWLREQGHTVQDFGGTADEPSDYPVIASRVAQKVAGDVCALGVLLCGTGIGMSIAANKVRGIRAACCAEPRSAALTRMHNDSNILCIGARMISPEQAKLVLAAWLGAVFEGGRHAARVEMIREMEN